MTDPKDEIQAMGKIADALGELDDDAARRVLRWALERFTGGGPVEVDTLGVSSTDQGGALEFDDLSDLFSAAAPTSQADQALVASYWVQEFEGEEDFESQRVNTLLKHLGHGVGNITRALESLKGRKPQHVVQLRKSGSSRQARKRYKVTAAGKEFVRELIRAGRAA